MTGRTSGTGPYNWAHRRRRAALIRQALGTYCPGAHGGTYRSARCDGLMADPRRMQLDHSTPVALGGGQGDVICCLPCNTGAGGALGSRMRRPRPPRATRQW